MKVWKLWMEGSFEPTKFFNVDNEKLQLSPAFPMCGGRVVAGYLFVHTKTKKKFVDNV